MKTHAMLCVSLAAIVLAGAPGAAEAQFFNFGIGPRPYFVSPNFYASGPSYFYQPYNSGYSYYPYNPYIAPLPAYGILPPALAVQSVVGNASYGGVNSYYSGGRTAQDYGYGYLDTPRKRTSTYPAVPYENTPPVDQAAEARRARIIVNVPTEDAEVQVDGAITKQKGLTRTFQTPPLADEKTFSSFIEVIWHDQAGKLQNYKEQPKYQAGQTITITAK